MRNIPNSRRARLIRRAPRARTFARSRMLGARERRVEAAFARAAGVPLQPWQLDVLAGVAFSIPLGAPRRRATLADLHRYYDGNIRRGVLGTWRER